VLGDLAVAEHGGDEFQKVWDRFGWANIPSNPGTPVDPDRDLQSEADRVLALLVQLSEATISAAIQGVSSWLEHWRRHVVASLLGLVVWLKMWPSAVAATNSQGESEDNANLSVTAAAVDNPHMLCCLGREP
jgi:hypothetical protein